MKISEDINNARAELRKVDKTLEIMYSYFKKIEKKLKPEVEEE